MKTHLVMLFAVSALVSGNQIAVADPADSSVYEQALADTSRLEDDAARDAGRKPAEVLAFMGVMPGMTVLDMFSGGGYYSEILSNVVGGDGQVVAHSNKAYLQFVGDEFVSRYAGGRLPNVDILMAENNKLRLDEDHFDVIMMALAYHDTHWVNPDGGWLEIDRSKLNTELFNSLKAGGVLGIVDHYAKDGASIDSVADLHRIDRSIVVAELAAAGFVLEAESDILRNPDDDHTLGVFAPEIRGNTDRFVLRFRKPE
jgi:predicted methyltransferase